MHYSILNRLDDKYLSEVQEIRVHYRDRKSIINLIEKYPNADILLYIEASDWIDETVKINKMLQGKLIVAAHSIHDCILAKKNDIRFILNYPITDFYTLQGLKNLGAESVRLGPPLSFQLAKVKALGVRVRANPTEAMIDDIPRADGVCGFWIRPEDIKLYEQYIDILEISTNDFKKDEALYRLYSNKKEWGGQLGEIIKGLNYLADNPLISPELAKRRIGCAQTCQEGSSCRLCYRVLDLANKDKIKALKNE